MHEARARRSSSALLAAAKAAGLRASRLSEFLCDLANCRDERLDWLGKKYSRLLQGRYSSIHLANYRDELRALWYPAATGIPHYLFERFEEWREDRPNAEPGEMICNGWLTHSDMRLFVVWERNRRELIPGPADLPAHLAYGCLLFGDRMRYCRNPMCATRYFVRSRRGQKYCSSDCAWPAKRAAKRKWWRENRSQDSKTGILSGRTKP